MNLRIGIPSKGRLAEIAAELLVAAGLKFRRSERSLFARVRDMPIDITFLRTNDIPVLCAEGAIDMGVTGDERRVAKCFADLREIELGVAIALARKRHERRDTAIAPCVPLTNRTSGLKATNSAASASRRSYSPSAKRRSTRRFLPST